MELTAPTGRIRFAIATAGAASLLAQVVLLREILASSQGNELVLGLVLALWLFLTGVACALAGRLSALRAARSLAVLLQIAPCLLLLALALTKLARPDALGGEPSLARVFGAAAAATLPACLLAGLSFAWAQRALDDARPGGGVYVAESLGAAVGGLTFHFVLVDRMGSAWVLFFAGTLCALAGMGLRRSGRGIRACAVGVLAIASSAALTPPARAWLAQAGLPGQTLLVAQPSRYGLLSVVARADQRAFFHDGVLLFTNQDGPAAEESFHLPMLLHPAPKRVLVVGGGLGGGLAEVLKHPVDHVDYAELDPGILPLARAFAGDATRAALDDSRVRVVSGDGRTLLAKARAFYDLVILDIPVAENALVARFSSRECFAQVKHALAPGGILALITPGSDTYLDRAARQRHASLLATLERTFPNVGVAPGAPTILWAAEGEVDATPIRLSRRLAERGLRLSQIGETWLFDRLLPFHAQSYRRALASVPAVESGDFRPVVYLFGWAERLQRVSPGASRAIVALLPSRRVAWALTGGFVLFGLSLAWLARGRHGPMFAAGAGGAAGMAIELVLLLGFQAVAGHLYHALGLGLAGFMVGLTLGALAGGRFLGRPGGLAGACAVAALLAGLSVAVLLLARAYPGLAPVVLVCVVVVGAANGAIYPLAVHAAGPARAGVTLYAWDLIGAAGAALVATLLAIPLLGLLPVAAGAGALVGLAALANLRR